MSQQTGKYVLVNGLKMYYELHGQGYPLVLIHGGGSTIDSTFGRVLQTFAATHMVIAVEMQAHGRTTDMDRPMTFEQDADDIAALLAHLDIPKADIFGFSNGGTTTLQVAIRHPQLVNKIVVASGMYKRDGTYPWFWDMMSNSSLDDMPDALKQAYLHVNPSQEGLVAMYNRDVSRMIAFKDIDEAYIRAIKASALIVQGDQDVVTTEHAVELYRNIPGASLLILPGGHGDYIGEISALKAGTVAEYPAVAVIEAFLNAPSN